MSDAEIVPMVLNTGVRPEFTTAAEWQLSGPSAIISTHGRPSSGQGTCARPADARVARRLPGAPRLTARAALLEPSQRPAHAADPLVTRRRPPARVAEACDRRPIEGDQDDAVDGIEAGVLSSVGSESGCAVDSRHAGP